MSMSSYCYHKVFSNHISQLNIGFHNVPYSCAVLFCHKTMSLTIFFWNLMVIEKLK